MRSAGGPSQRASGRCFTRGLAEEFSLQNAAAPPGEYLSLFFVLSVLSYSVFE